MDIVNKHGRVVVMGDVIAYAKTIEKGAGLASKDTINVYAKNIVSKGPYGIVSLIKEYSTEESDFENGDLIIFGDVISQNDIVLHPQ